MVEIVLLGLVCISLSLQILAFYYLGIEWKWMKAARDRSGIIEKNIAVLKNDVFMVRDRINYFKEEIEKVREFVRSQLEKSKEFL